MLSSSGNLPFGVAADLSLENSDGHEAKRVQFRVGLVPSCRPIAIDSVGFSTYALYEGSRLT